MKRYLLILMLSITGIISKGSFAQSGAVLDLSFLPAGSDATYWYVDVYMTAGTNYVTNHTDYGTVNGLGSWSGCNLRFTTPAVTPTAALAASMTYTPVGGGFPPGPVVSFVTAGGCYPGAPAFNISLTRQAPAVDADATPFKIGRIGLPLASFPAGTQLVIRTTTTQACANRESFWSNPANVGSGRSEVANGAAVVTLPVSLTGFSAQLQPNCTGVKLNWATASEQNSNWFVIERSSKGTWKNIGMVAAAGNSYNNKSYSFTDATANGGSYLYRLRMQDIDGKEKLSNIVTVQLNCANNNYYIYPNPVQDVLNIQVPAGAMRQVQVYNGTGQLVKTIGIGGNSAQTIAAGNWTKGIYQVVVTENGAVVHTQKIVKQ